MLPRGLRGCNIAAWFALNAASLLPRWSNRPILTCGSRFFFAVVTRSASRNPSLDDPAGARLHRCFCCSRRRRVARRWLDATVRRALRPCAACAARVAVRLERLRTLWLLPGNAAGRSSADALGGFWFDVTKSDWRDTMVLNVPRSCSARTHAAMYWFEICGSSSASWAPCLRVAGLALLGPDQPPARDSDGLPCCGERAIFAFSYNVGDSHVFYLPCRMLSQKIAVVASRSLARRRDRARSAGRSRAGSVRVANCSALPARARYLGCSTPAAAPIAISRRLPRVGAGTSRPAARSSAPAHRRPSTGGRVVRSGDSC
jgi:hypothetical protein